VKTFFDFIDLAPKWEKIADAARQRKAKKEGRASGLHYNPLTRSAALGRRTDVNYLACAVKPA